MQSAVMGSSNKHSKLFTGVGYELAKLMAANTESINHSWEKLGEADDVWVNIIIIYTIWYKS